MRSQPTAPYPRVRLHIIRNARIEYVGKSQSCMVVAGVIALAAQLPRCPVLTTLDLTGNAGLGPGLRAGDPSVMRASKLSKL